MTITFTPHPIAKCLNFGACGNGEAVLTPIDNEKQIKFAKIFDLLKKDFAKMPEDMLKAIASGDVKVVNKYLADNGFPELQLQDQGEGLYVASIFECFVKWLIQGQNTKIFDPKTRESYDAVNMSEYGVEIFRVNLEAWVDGKIDMKEVRDPSNVTTVVRIKTQDDHRQVFLADLSKFADEYDLYAKMKQIKELYDDNNAHHKGLFEKEKVIFPKIKLSREEDIAYFAGMSVGTEEHKNNFFVTQAKQKTLFKMNCEGAEVRSAVVMTVKRCIDMDDRIIFNEPFSVAVCDDRYEGPLFVAFLDKDVWVKS